MDLQLSRFEGIPPREHRELMMGTLLRGRRLNPEQCRAREHDDRRVKPSHIHSCPSSRGRLVVSAPYRQHRTRGATDDVFRRRAEHQPIERVPAVHAHDDQIDQPFVGGAKNLDVGSASYDDVVGLTAESHPLRDRRAKSGLLMRIMTIPPYQGGSVRNRKSFRYGSRLASSSVGAAVEADASLVQDHELGAGQRRGFGWRDPHSPFLTRRPGAWRCSRRRGSGA